MLAGVCVALAFVALLVASTLKLHFRGRVRQSIRRQIADYSTLLSPYNAWVCARQSLPARPVHDVEQFPELGVLRENWREIRDELLALSDEHEVRSGARQDDLVFYSFCKRGWRRFYLTWYGGTPDSAERSCPRTLELLRSIPNVYGAMFAVLPPGSRLGKHRDPFGGVLRYHLGLVTPGSPDCRLFVDEEERIWRDGEAILFDPMYLHKAYNRTDVPRMVLFCDVERPLRGKLSAVINRFVMRRCLGMTVTGNTDGDRVSVANRLFAGLKPLRHAITATKQSSPAVYYALKYVVLAAPFLAIAWLVMAMRG